MSRMQKRLQRLYNAPNAISADEISWLLRAIGFEERRATGSHRIFRHPELRKMITIPNRNPLKIAYVIQVRKLIKDVMEIIENGQVD